MGYHIPRLTLQHVLEIEVASVVWDPSEARMLEKIEAAIWLFELRLPLISSCDNFSYIGRLLGALSTMMALISSMFGLTLVNRQRREALTPRLIAIFRTFGLIILTAGNILTFRLSHFEPIRTQSLVQWG